MQVRQSEVDQFMLEKDARSARSIKWMRSSLWQAPAAAAWTQETKIWTRRNMSKVTDFLILKL